MSNLPTKRCEECGAHFTPSKYAVNRTRFCSRRCGHRNHCARNREAHNAKARRWRAANPEKVREINRRADLKNKYGLTPEDYEQILSKQDGRCAICRAPARSGYLCVDHDHVTGDVRGLLCGRCNAVLGYAEDSPVTLRSAIHYLEETTYAAALD